MSRLGKCSNTGCPNSKKKVTLPAMGLCGTCYAKVRAGKLVWLPKTLDDPLEMREVQNQQHPSPEVKSVRKDDELPDADHSSQPGKMVPALTAPFVLSGFEFDPNFQLPPPAVPPTVRLSVSGNFHISKSAFLRFDLGRYGHVVLIPSRGKDALAVIFSEMAQPGSRRLAPDSKSPNCPKASARNIQKAFPEIVGKKLVLRETDVPGAFVAVVDGEAV